MITSDSLNRVLWDSRRIGGRGLRPSGHQPSTLSTVIGRKCKEQTTSLKYSRQTEILPSCSISTTSCPPETATGEERDALLEQLDEIEYEAGRDYQRVRRQIDDFLKRRGVGANWTEG